MHKFDNKIHERMNDLITIYLNKKSKLMKQYHSNRTLYIKEVLINQTKNRTSFIIEAKEKHIAKVNESRYKQCGVIPHFPTGQNLLQKIFRKDKY